MSYAPTQQDADQFVLAAAKGDLAAAAEFLDQYPAFSNVVNSSGATALAMAAANEQTEIAKLLLAKGAWIDKRDEKGMTPLMFAVLNGCTKTAETLLDKGAAIDAKDHTGWTILMQAAHAGLTDSVKFLLEKGAATDWVDENEQTAEMLARWGGHHAIADLIDGWSILPSGEEKEPPRAETPVKDLTAERLEKLKNQRPKQSPFTKPKP
ncbi:MAG: ankyrin repeat domain-containing protein [Alphaproteobacteria bacterium]|nr:ankyrin repeat domain-containing protein [Alphaproteobacteria bacterium]